MLFGGYRRGDANDPDAYVAAIAAVLAMYDSEIIRKVTDPRTGISTHEKFRAFMPNSGELKAYCDEQATIAARLRRFAELPRPNFERLPPPPKAPGCRANLLVMSDAPGYQRMVDLTPKADPLDWRWDEDGRGIWVPFGWYEETKGRGENLAEQRRAILDAARRACRDEVLPDAD